MEQFRSHAVTHPGTKRDHNEDMFVDRSDLGLWAVADGAGGHEAGEVASEMIATTLETIPLELTAEEMLAQVRLRISATHTALRECAARKGEGALVASTVVVLHRPPRAFRLPLGRRLARLSAARRHPAADYARSQPCAGTGRRRRDQ